MDEFQLFFREQKSQDEFSVTKAIIQSKKVNLV